MAAKLVYVVDDHDFNRADTVDSVETAKAGFDLQIKSFRDGESARRAWQQERPAVVVLDLKMPAPDGFELLRWWRDQPRLTATKVFVYSNVDTNPSEIQKFGAEFCSKADGFRVFETRLRQLFKALPAYAKDSDEHLLEVFVAPGERTLVKSTGAFSADDQSDEPLGIRCDQAGPYVDALLSSPQWFGLVQTRGLSLYRGLLADAVQALYQQVRLSARMPENLHVRFVAGIACADLGFETLFDRPPESNGEFFARKHPMAVRVAGIAAKQPAINRDYLNGLLAAEKPLRVLLIGANPAANVKGSLLPPMPNVDPEIEFLSQKIPEWFKNTGIETEVVSLSSSESDIATIRDLAQQQRFDIWHIAGHGWRSERTPEKNGLWFWERREDGNAEFFCDSAELERLLIPSRASFLFLNSCRSGSQGASYQLARGRLLGLAHAALRAGVTSVCCFRTPVADVSASTFAIAFYENLAQTGETDMAMQQARIKSYSNTDSTWLSAMLMDQAT